MAEEIKRRKLTRIELVTLGVVLVFALLAGTVWMARMRVHSWKTSCAANLSNLAKAMMLYPSDYGDELPQAGGPGSQWTGRIADWTAGTRRDAYGLQDGAVGQVSISASLYLLVKYSEMPTKTVLCGETKWGTRERGITEFRVDTYPVAGKNAELIDFWDFGPDPTRHVSYAYQMPYGTHKLQFSAGPRFVIAADRNPWMDSPAAKARDFSGFQPDLRPYNGTPEQARHGNTTSHRSEGQNALFLDRHVEFRDRPFSSPDHDNIYTAKNNRDTARGVLPQLGSVPADARDSLLVNDPLRPSK
jgi:hypothetical protein